MVTHTMTAVHPLLDQTRELLAASLAGRSAEQVGRHPGGDPARWSAQQVIEHLSATWRSTAKGIEDRLQKNRPLLTRPTLAQRCKQLAVCECGFLPRHRKAPPAVEPSQNAEPLNGDELIARFSETLGAMDRVLDQIEPQAKNAPVLTHFLLGPMNVRQWRRFHSVHARHHVKQIERAVRPDLSHPRFNAKSSG
jgi:DinB superfamily